VLPLLSKPLLAALLQFVLCLPPALPMFDKDKILKKCHTFIDEAEKFWTDYVSPQINYRRQVYTGDKDYYEETMPYLSSKSGYISSDAYVAVERTVGSLLKIYFGGQDVVQIQGTPGNSSAEAAKDRQELINYQLTELNKGFTKFKFLFTDELVNLIGFVKIFPYTKEDWVEQEPIFIPSEEMINEALDYIAGGQKTKVLKKEPSELGGFVVSWAIWNVVEQYPKLEILPIEEVLWSPRAKVLGSADFVCHKVKKTIDELRRNIKKDGKGMYDAAAVEKVAEMGDSWTKTEYEEDNYPEREPSPLGDDDPGKEVTVYECYIKHDINEDGLLEPVIATICGNVVLRAEENPYKRVPIFKVSPNEETHKVLPDTGMIDFLCKLTELDTAMVKLWQANLALNNDPQTAALMEYIEDSDDLENREKVIKIRGTDDVRKAIQVVPTAQIDATTLKFMEMKEQKEEKVSAVTRINQGIGGEVQGLNKTKGGMELTVGLSNQQIENIARCNAESEDGIADMFEFMVYLNEKYPPPEEQVIELIGRPLTPIPGNVSLRYEVDPTLGTGVRQQNIQNYQAMAMTAVQDIQAGIMNQQGYYELRKAMLEEMGVKNTDKFYINPQEVQNGIGIPGNPGNVIGGTPGAFGGMPQPTPQGNNVPVGGSPTG
jgi:hypothetical protein